MKPSLKQVLEDRLWCLVDMAGVSAKDLAERLQVHMTTIYRWRSQGPNQRNLTLADMDAILLAIGEPWHKMMMPVVAEGDLQILLMLRNGSELPSSRAEDLGVQHLVAQGLVLVGPTRIEITKEGLEAI